MWLAILSAGAAGLAALAVFFVVTARRIARPTRGDGIAGDAGRTALVVIDMQEDFTRSGGPAGYDETRRRRALGRVNELLDTARRRGDPVAVVCQEHKGRAVQLVARLALGGAGNPGRPGARLDRDLDAAGFPVFVKHVADAFSVPAFDAWLRAEKVGTLVLTGLDLAHCVRATALGARNRGYSVTVDLEGSLAANDKAWGRARDELEAAGVTVSRAAGSPHPAA